MGKIYIDTVKYIIRGTIEIDGIVEKPDVVGAIFGQTEGLLGEELDLRELQKSGRIGRIEVEIKTISGKSVGELTLQSSLSKEETAIIGAALETVDRVGPCIARIKINSIEDTRSNKREFVVSRAKELLSSLTQEKIPESKEISDKVRSELRMSELCYYGEERLPCGPEIDGSDEIIVVEGRADVLNLLRYGFKNIVSLSGAIIPKSVIDLSKKKITTLFVDGDRGGDITIRQFSENGKIDFIAKAPDGKEVEELTKKEVIKCLRNKVPFSQIPKKPFERQDPLITIYENVKGTMKAALVGGDGKIIEEVPVADMLNIIQKREDLYAVVFDGIITQRLIDLASERKISVLVGLKEAKIENRKNVKTITTYR